MNYNLKRHKLLKELDRLNSVRDKSNTEFNCNEISITFREIDKLLNVSISERDYILSGLCVSNEISLCEIPADDKSYQLNYPIGFYSFSSKKYIKQNQDIFINWLRNFTHIFIPIASLIITFFVLIKSPKDNYNKLDTELQTIKQKVEYIEKVQNKKGRNPNYQIHKTE